MATIWLWPNRTRYAADVIRVRMSMSDVQRTRFVHSPLAELAKSLCIVSSGRVHPVHRSWYDEVEEPLRKVDRELLEALVPRSKGKLARFLLPTATAGTATIETQLHKLAVMPAEQLHRDLTLLWGDELPPPARRLLAEGPAGPRRICDALWEYWTIAVAPYWPAIHAVIDKDITHRASTLTRQGVAVMFSELHRRVRLHGDTLYLDMTPANEREMTGSGMTLVPSVFAWPYLIFDVDATTPSSLTYPARGIGELWTTPSRGEDDTLGALLGRNRAKILTNLATPHATIALAQRVGLSPPSVNQHLSVLRSAGLVTSWRSGRFVFYERTALGTSVVVASRSAG